MKSKLILIAGFLMVPMCLLGLLWQESFIWAICPQALVVMFIRQSLHGYDSLGAADYPDFAVALLYYPLIGWILSRAFRQGRFERMVAHVAIWHAVAIILAVSIVGIRRS